MKKSEKPEDRVVCRIQSVPARHTEGRPAEALPGAVCAALLQEAAGELVREPCLKTVRVARREDTPSFPWGQSRARLGSRGLSLPGFGEMAG